MSTSSGGLADSLDGALSTGGVLLGDNAQEAIAGGITVYPWIGSDPPILALATRGVAATGDQRIDGMLQGVAWNATTVTYGFPDSTAAYEYPYGAFNEPWSDGFAQVSATQQATLRALLEGGTAGNAVSPYGAVEAFTRLDLVASATGSADLRIAESGLLVAPAWTYVVNSGPYGGDIWFLSYPPYYDFRAPVIGSYEYHGHLHEVGHALGLKEAHLARNGLPALPPEWDSLEFTVATYRSHVGAATDYYTNEAFGFPQGFMMLDIAALQYLYGADFTTSAGDTTYSWSPITGQMSVDGVGQGIPGANRVFLTIWDGGGRDTYDFSAYATGVRVDLAPGGYSVTAEAQRAILRPGDAYQPAVLARGNVFNALTWQGDPRSLIEDAIGGTGNDSLAGNVAANRLAGGAGADTLDGGPGADTLDGGAGNDLVYVDDAGDVVQDLPGGGLDTVMAALSWTLGPDLEQLRLTGEATDGTGNALANTLIGTAGRNALDGAGGDDLLLAADEADTLCGGAGADTMVGGWGSDTYLFGRGDGQDRLLDITGVGGYADLDTLLFGAGIARGEVAAWQEGGDAVLGLASGERVAIVDALIYANQRIETFRFADGTTLGWDEMTAPAFLALAGDVTDREEGTATDGVALCSFTVTRSGNAGGAARVAWSVTGSGAHPADAADFLGGVLPSGTLDFAAGETTQTIKVRVVKDSTIEPDEGFAVALADPFGATITDGLELATIRNDDWAPTWLAIARRDADHAEGTRDGNSIFRFTVTRSGELARPSQVDWTVAGSGTRPADTADFAGHAMPSGRLAFAAGEASHDIEVAVARDSLFETHEGFAVRLLAPSGGTVTTAQATGVIRNDDLPATFLAIAPAVADHAEGTAATGGSVFSFTVTRSGDLSVTSRADWSVTGSSVHPADAADFLGGVLPGGSFTFLAGESSRTLNIRVARDSLVEPHEGFAVRLSNATGASIATANATGVIRNDDLPPTWLGIAPALADQAEGTRATGSTDFTFTVTRTGDLGGASQANWSVAGSGPDPADAADFLGGVLPSGRVAFAAGEASRTIHVRVLPDALAETDEAFAVTLAASSGASLLEAVAAGLIRNDDASPLPAGDLHLFG